MERGRIKKPGQERYRVELSEYYTARDLFVGARIDINNFMFELIDADEYCYRYMEKHSGEVSARQNHKPPSLRCFVYNISAMFATFPLVFLQFNMSDIGRVMQKLAGGVGDVSKAESLQQFCDFRRFVEILQEKAPGVLNEQELRTVARCVRVTSYPPLHCAAHNRQQKQRAVIF